MPGWAHRIDDYGRRHGYRDKPRHDRKGEYIGSVIVNLILLWVVNKIPDWHPEFIRENYMVVLWMLNVNILVRIGGNILMLAVDLSFIRYLSRIIMECASFITQMMLYFIFPFDFTNYGGFVWLNWFIPIILIIGMAISAAKIISNTWKLFFRRNY